jgi:hypothetical protein
VRRDLAQELDDVGAVARAAALAPDDDGEFEPRGDGLGQVDGVVGEGRVDGVDCGVRAGSGGLIMEGTG